MRCAGSRIAVNRSANEIHQGEITSSIRLGLNTFVIALGETLSSDNIHNQALMVPPLSRVVSVVRMYA